MTNRINHIGTLKGLWWGLIGGLAGTYGHGSSPRGRIIRTRTANRYLFFIHWKNSRTFLFSPGNKAIRRRHNGCGYVPSAGSGA